MQHKWLAVIVTSLGGCLLLLVAVFVGSKLALVVPALSGVNIANEYHATTTNATSIGELYLTTTTGDIYATRSGALGSVILTATKWGSGNLDIFDATTTVASRRAASMTTNTILLASIPTSNSTGTFIFDETYFNGLVAVFVGTIPTTTITYR